MIHGLLIPPFFHGSSNPLHPTVTFSPSFSVQRERSCPGYLAPVCWNGPAYFSPWSTGPGLPIVHTAIGISSLVLFLKFLFPPHSIRSPSLVPHKQVVTRSMSSLSGRTASEPCRFRSLPKFHAKCNGQFLLVSFHFPDQKQQKIGICYCLRPLKEHRSNKRS